MTSEREAYVYIQLPGTLETVPAALLRVQTLPDGTQMGGFATATATFNAKRQLHSIRSNCLLPRKSSSSPGSRGFPVRFETLAPTPGDGA